MNYYQESAELSLQIDAEATDKIVSVLKEAYDGDRTVFVAGNGGSAATANHFCCDFGKNAVKYGKRVKVISLSTNVEIITAVANDISYEDIFSEQLNNLMQKGDLMILISASGNSPNVIRAAQYAKTMGNTVIGLCGFDGGQLNKLSNISIVSRSRSYEHIEDMHSMILHAVVCGFKQFGL